MVWVKRFKDIEDNKYFLIKISKICKTYFKNAYFLYNCTGVLMFIAKTYCIVTFSGMWFINHFHISKASYYNRALCAW